MNNNRKLPQKAECCPKIVIYTEDFYMTFGNCKKDMHFCPCEEINGYKNLLKMFFQFKEIVTLITGK